MSPAEEADAHNNTYLKEHPRANPPVGYKYVGPQCPHALPNDLTWPTCRWSYNLTGGIPGTETCA